MLEKIKIKPGERVAIISENCPQYIAAITELWQSGAILVAVNPSYPVEKMAGCLMAVGCSRVISGFNKKGSIIQGFSGSTFNWKVYSFDEFKINDCAGRNSHINSMNPWFFFMSTGLFDPSGKLNNPASIIFTSGSTNKPRAVLHTAGNHYYSALGSNENIKLSSQDIWLLCLPLYHISGLSLIMRTNISASSIAVASTKSQEMELSGMIEKSGATHISLVPTQLYRLMHDTSAVKLLQKLKAILVGGGVMADELTKECLKNKLNIFKSYGLSEMASQVTTTAPSDLPKHMYSSGKLLAYRELAISPDNQILVKGKTLFSGYAGSKENKHKDKIENKLCSTQYRQPVPGFYLPIDSEGWFYTGDTGYIDEEGYLHVIGRMYQMFISKGENIYPEEIENAILGYPGIEEAIVVPVEDRDAGKVCAAFIRFGTTSVALQNAKNLSPGKNPEIAKNSILQEKLERYLTLKIEKVKIPRYYFDWPTSRDTRLKPDREKLKTIALKLVGL